MYAPLTTVDAVKAWAYAGNNKATADDKQIQTLIGRCSELIGRHCSRANLGEVLPFSELRFTGGAAKRFFQDRMWTLVLRNYPIVSVTSISTGSGNSIPIITPDQVMGGSWGAWVEDDIEPRAIKFFGVQTMNPGALSIAYTAGYNGVDNVPGGLAQACCQYVMEVMRSANNLLLKSNALAGETTTFDTGDLNWGMSNRTLAMLQPYKDVAGWGL